MSKLSDILSPNRQIIVAATPNDPIFHPLHRMTAYFLTDLSPIALRLRKPVGACTSLSYLSAPPGYNSYKHSFRLNAFQT